MGNGNAVTGKLAGRSDHPGRQVERVKPVAKPFEKIVPDSHGRGPFCSGNTVVWPDGNGVELEGVSLLDGGRVNKVGDLPFCPSCGRDLQQKITNGEYAVVHFEAVGGD